MNAIAIDIGNSHITIGFFAEDKDSQIVNISDGDENLLSKVLTDLWQQVPVLEASKEQKRDGVFVMSSVKPEWTQLVKKTVKQNCNENVLQIGTGKDIPLPMTLAVENPETIGVDRVVMAAAAYDVVSDVVAVADFGTAVTIDLVDENGLFLGGTILPGFEMSAKVMQTDTAALPDIGKVQPPDLPYGKNTAQAINNGLYYSAVGALEIITRKYAEELGKWPQTIITGGAMNTIKEDCLFVESFVPDLAVKGVLLAYKKYIANKD